MEWKRVKTILIGVLLITCLLLTGNILRQVRASKVQERQAVRDACGVAARTGVRIDAALVLALPERSAVLTAARDSVSEARAGGQAARRRGRPGRAGRRRLDLHGGKTAK
jgi:hypothetical protein